MLNTVHVCRIYRWAFEIFFLRGGLKKNPCKILFDFGVSYLRVWRRILTIVDRKEDKQRNFTESETKHFVRNHNKNSENAIFWTRDGDTPILGEIYIMLVVTRKAREKKGSPVCGGRKTSKV